MKIILATPLYPPEVGGPATYTKELATRLAGSYDVVIVAYADAPEQLPQTTLFAVSKRRPLPLRLLAYATTLYRAAKDADLIYAQNAVAAGLPAVLVGTLRGVPVVLKFVGDEAWERASQERRTKKPLEEFLAAPEGGWRTRLVMAVQGFALRRAGAVTTPSAYLLEAVIRTYGVGKNRAFVNYNAAEPEHEATRETKQTLHQVAVTARLVEWKGVDGVIRATALLAKRFPDVRTVIAGDGPEEGRLQTLARELGIGERVKFLGRVSRAETWRLRKSSEVYALNSAYEGLPHTALTSFAAGIPTVATDIPGTNEAVYDGVSGLLVPQGDDAALADAITRLFEDAGLRARLVEGGKKLLAEKFSWEAHLATLFWIFESVRAEPRH